MKSKIKLLSSSKGLTLIEILASITILSIIVVTFLTFFIQSARTNTVSEDIMDATYVAQTQMEEIYNLSKSPYEDAITSLTSKGTHTENNGIDKFQIVNETYKIQLQLKQTDTNLPNLKDVLVKVYDNSNGRLGAQMETKISWEN
ncbi:type II secretion system GspH family protein [Aquibacillus koreensis]|uniref:Type II secretion system GspH family protein n=1 Tax=Aquibacillus koreensis TaxID=279446 RepID=A0A9X4AIC8_9BACI|nr:type II secretion system protein [Aquibacillus koreensis]MCT2537941.1 type II secretion system GspH family protein [Aquibacillus koreensis]MDC3419168.1 type II secretion system GspH family protein [Aquibacillus koreensis]